jgi:hypothetical protein
LLLQLEELLRPEKAPKIEGNKRQQDSHEEPSRLSWAEKLGRSRSQFAGEYPPNDEMNRRGNL